MEKPTCKLVDESGDVFAVIGKVSNTLKNNGQPDKAISSQSYSDVLVLCSKYVKIE